MFKINLRVFWNQILRTLMVDEFKAPLLPAESKVSKVEVKADPYEFFVIRRKEGRRNINQCYDRPVVKENSYLILHKGICFAYLNIIVKSYDNGYVTEYRYGESVIQLNVWPHMCVESKYESLKGIRMIFSRLRDMLISHEYSFRQMSYRELERNYMHIEPKYLNPILKNIKDHIDKNN